MKKSVLLLTAVTLSLSLFTGCSKSSNVPQNAEVVTKASTTAQMTTEAITSTPENVTEKLTEAITTEVATTPAPHTHTYIETITTEVACVAEGVKTYSCECGDSYTEAIPATGHTYGTYTYNDDATYTYDGTESAACLSCGHSDVRVAAGTMLSYTYTDMDATMHAQQTVNVRSLPNADGEKLGSLSTNDEVKVTGQCVETNWYRIEYSGNVAYVSNEYLGNDKVVVEQPKTEQTNNTSTTNSNVVMSAGGYNVIKKNGYSFVDATVSTYEEACTIAKALGYDVYQVHDGTWFYGLCGRDSDDDTRRTYTDAGLRISETRDLAVPGGFIWIGEWYLVRWVNY